MSGDYMPNCDNCAHANDCAVRKALREARETLFNIGREKAGRTDFVYKGKIIEAEGVE